MAGGIARGEITFEQLDPAHATRELAVGTAMVIRDAYAARFPSVPPNLIAHFQSADSLNSSHVDETLGYLRRGPEQGWYWALANHRHLGYTAVLGVALCMARDNEVFLGELHTHPEVQRQGIATNLAALAIQAASQDPSLVAMGPDPGVMLYVARERPDDNTEHPANFYRSIGLGRVGGGELMTFGRGMMLTDQMRGSVGNVLANLNSRQQR